MYRMPVLDHTIVRAHDHERSAAFVAALLGRPEPVTLGHFAAVHVGEVTMLDYVHVDGPVTSQHDAFLVTETEFDQIVARICDQHLPYWADPQHEEPDRINTWDGGRGVYFDDPNGHRVEIITRPYGSGGTTTDHPHPLVARTA
jgi:catechol 2,3-dioxygenase-like lactoylglutathione lyase family enzyme